MELNETTQLLHILFATLSLIFWIIESVRLNIKTLQGATRNIIYIHGSSNSYYIIEVKF